MLSQRGAKQGAPVWSYLCILLWCGAFPRRQDKWVPRLLHTNSYLSDWGPGQVAEEFKDTGDSTRELSRSKVWLIRYFVLLFSVAGVPRAQIPLSDPGYSYLSRVLFVITCKQQCTTISTKACSCEIQALHPTDLLFSAQRRKMPGDSLCSFPSR